MGIVLFTDVHEGPPEHNHRTYTMGEQHSRVVCSFPIPVTVGLWLTGIRFHFRRICGLHLPPTGEYLHRTPCEHCGANTGPSSRVGCVSLASKIRQSIVAVLR